MLCITYCLSFIFYNLFYIHIFALYEAKKIPKMCILSLTHIPALRIALFKAEWKCSRRTLLEQRNTQQRITKTKIIFIILGAFTINFTSIRAWCVCICLPNVCIGVPWMKVAKRKHWQWIHFGCCALCSQCAYKTKRFPCETNPVKRVRGFIQKFLSLTVEITLWKKTLCKSTFFTGLVWTFCLCSQLQYNYNGTWIKKTHPHTQRSFSHKRNIPSTSTNSHDCSSKGSKIAAAAVAGMGENSVGKKVLFDYIRSTTVSVHLLTASACFLIYSFHLFVYFF